MAAKLMNPQQTFPASRYSGKVQLTFGQRLRGSLKHNQAVPELPFMLAALTPYLSNPRQSLLQILNFGLVLSTAFMLWKTLSVVADSPSPIVVVLSGSMEPAFQRGDLLFLWNRDKRAEVGEIVVYNVKGKDIPIVHRVVRSFTLPAAIGPSDKYAAHHS
jgi:hypothetical protein